MVTIKICGLVESPDIIEISKLKPDYMGFIFYEKSPRYAGTKLDTLVLKEIDPEIIKTGVFVNETESVICKIVEKYGFQAVQLHGDETPDLAERLKLVNPDLIIIKAFRIEDDFSPDLISSWEAVMNMALFDTATDSYGGSGKSFNWELLKSYKAQNGFLLAGGIGPDNIREALSFINGTDMAFGVDVNSGVEIRPGKKSIEAVASVIKEVRGG